ncbi:androgen-dependent TFPI-regulating protein-like [Battus philenor]|uniref:androgen-dependent TFPI-regulating protein-like n=1 Tax=Battus philenor TaxID=42288 RepID=UPI0035D02429
MKVTISHAPHRLFGYALTLALHGGNSVAMYIALQGDVMKDPDVQKLYSLRWVYLTIWNVMYQLLYAFLGILCDLPTFLEIKEHKYLKHLKVYRELLFVSIILPLGLGIFSFFWPLYIYDREMIFPSFIDRAFSQVSNHIMHTAIAPIVLWDLIFLPKYTPRSHKWNLIHTFGFYFSYLFVLFSTFAARGIWPYPILKTIYGTMYFPMVFVIIALYIYGLYWGQWHINALLWRSNSKVKE